MNPSRHLLASRAVCAALFLPVVFAFGLNYGLVLAGLRENQIPKPPKGTAPIDWRTDGIRTWGWHLKTDVEEFAKQNALFRIPFSELNMGFRKLAGMRLFPDADRTLRLNNGYLVIPRQRFDTENCARQIVELRDYCSTLGASFLYVVAPHKSDRFDDQLPLGMEDHGNENADQFVASMAAHGVPTLDLRDLIHEHFADFYGLFFRTDHHWKPETGLWAAAQIAEALNRLFNFGLSLDLFDSANYEAETHKGLFLGSLGKKVTRAYVAPDDFTLITPKFDTALRLAIPANRLDLTGTFREALIKADYLSGPPDFYRRNTYETYLRGDNDRLAISNLLRPDGKRVLMLKDSSANVVIPFLALALKSIDVLDLRYFSGSVYAYIERQRPDAVIVLYSADSFRKEAFTVWSRHPLPVRKQDASHPL